jgi:SAM-dependent methyltransferase
MDFDAYERELWAGRAAAYAGRFGRLTAYTADFLLDAAQVTGGSAVLDVGTGPGTVAAAARKRGAAVSAIDADPQMVETAARGFPGLDVRAATLPDLPFPDAAFDAVVGNFVINHVAAPADTLAELRRVLRPGGRLALTCWPIPGEKAQSIVRDSIDAAGVSWPDDIPNPPFQTHGQPAAFEALVGTAGFADVAVNELVWDHVVDPEDWWAGPMAGVGSTGVVINRQNPATITRIKETYDRLIAEFAVGGGRVKLPARALLAHGTR